MNFTIRLYGGRHDGETVGCPLLPGVLWVGTCSCCGETTTLVIPVAWTDIQAQAREAGYVPYERDRLLPDGAWRYTTPGVDAHNDGIDQLVRHLGDEIQRRREAIPA